MSVLRSWPASSTRRPLSHSVASELAAMAEPHPNALNLASTIRPSSSTSIWSFITSPHSGAPTTPVPTRGEFLSSEPTFRGLVK